jgi:hypothetical protein
MPDAVEVRGGGGEPEQPLLSVASPGASAVEPAFGRHAPPGELLRPRRSERKAKRCQRIRD